MENLNAPAIIIAGIVGLMAKILFDWLKNGKIKEYTMPSECRNKLEGLSMNGVEQTTILKQILDQLKENGRELREYRNHA